MATSLSSKFPCQGSQLFSFNIARCLHCVALRCVALRCVALRCVALRCVALRCVALRCAQSNGVLSCCSAACNALHNILTWRAAIKRQLLTNDYLLVRHTGQSRGESLLHLYMLYVWGDIVHSSKSDCNQALALQCMMFTICNKQRT